MAHHNKLVTSRLLLRAVRLKLSSKSNMAWSKHLGRPLLVGVSCFAFLMPFVASLLMQRRARYIWVIQTLLAFMSDYVTSADPSFWHLADNAAAPVNFLGFAWLAFARSDLSAPHYCALLSAPLFFYGRSLQAISQQNFSNYQINHTLWHLLCGVNATVALLSVASPDAGDDGRLRHSYF